MRLSLCLNCLEATAVVDVPVGPDKGTQRDPYRDTLSLCPTCSGALLDGDFAQLAERHTAERTVRAPTT